MVWDWEHMKIKEKALSEIAKGLIAQRGIERAKGNFEQEGELTKQIRKIFLIVTTSYGK